MTTAWCIPRRLLFGLVVCLGLGSSVLAERVIIRTGKPYGNLLNEIRQAGGRVHQEFKYVDAVAVDVPEALLESLRARMPVGAITKDKLVELPRAARDRDGRPLLSETKAGRATGVAAVTGSGSVPDNYLINDKAMNLFGAFAGGNFGQGIKVAVIDSGYRPGFPAVDLDGSVIGGEDLVGDDLGWANFDNGGHGTFVISMVSGNIVFTFDPDSPFLAAVKRYCPGCVTGENGDQIPLMGSAPLSSVYALRVFPPDDGAPESRIIAAMERVIELRSNFDAGVPETQNDDGSFIALNIKVCNMSLGGPTLFAGRDLEDQLTRVMLDHDIVLVTSAGNAGPSGSTGGSPGTGPGAVTVGASSSPVHERILRDLQYGDGIGELFRPFNRPITAYFSSRGPTADGRPDPDMVANGDASFGQGFADSANGLSLGSGTSFAAPTVAGVAAVLRQMRPEASARQIRSALILGANPNYLKDGSTMLDQGSGFVDAAASDKLLQRRWMPELPAIPGIGTPSVRANIALGSGVQTFDGNVTQTARKLKPGQRHEVYYQVRKDTARVVVTLSNFKTGPAENAFFGDDLILSVHSAKTSAIDEGDYQVFAFTKGGSYEVEAPEEGLMRVTLSGDWTNADDVSATVNIVSVRVREPGLTAVGRLQEGEQAYVPVVVPEGAGLLDCKLSWDHDWEAYPANDLDLYLIDPDGNLDFTGATLNSPERTGIQNPTLGTWYVVIDGFSINSRQGDRYYLRAAVDGKVVK